jgi:hypothetical protein
MKLLWQIEDSDIGNLKLSYDAQKDNAFVLNRMRFVYN